MKPYIPVDWKEKQRVRSLENKALRKRLREVKQGRENWKNKYTLIKLERDELTNELQSIKKKLLSII